MRRNLSFAFGLLLLVAVLAGVTYTLESYRSENAGKAISPGSAMGGAGRPGILPGGASSGRGAAASIADVVEMVRNAVAFVSVRPAAGDFFLQPVPGPGMGSGVVFDTAGYVLTNDHILGDAKGIKVSLPDGRNFDATLVGRDHRSDLAVIKIDGQNLPALSLGDSSRLRVGETVIAMGNGLGLAGGPTANIGIVSATNRSVALPPGPLLGGLIQTDAAINSGNSGGPLVNASGEVVGINTAMTTVAQGIGFAIAIDNAKPIVNQLMVSGKVTRPWLGVEVVALTAAIASQFDLNLKEGIMVASVEAKSPAEQAGLRRRDVITAVDGRPLARPDQLRDVLDQKKVGDTVGVTVSRDGRDVTLTVRLADQPA